MGRGAVFGKVGSVRYHRNVKTFELEKWAAADRSMAAAAGTSGSCGECSWEAIVSCMLVEEDDTRTAQYMAKGLEAWADDYVTKPCAFEELLARVRALLRRRAPPEPLRRLVGTWQSIWRLGG